MSRPSPSELWDTLHIQQGRSREASQAAEAVVAAINTQDFTDQTVANEFGEYARIAEVTGVAAAKRSGEYQAARDDLMRSLKMVLATYPLADTEIAARQRGNYWETTYGTESAQLICLRDVWHLVQVLEHLFPSDQELTGFAHGVRELLAQLSDELKGERFGLIFVIEDGEYPAAAVAYEQFAAEYGPGSAVCDADQWATVTARFLRRAIEQKDTARIGQCAQALVSIMVTNRKLTGFTLKEIAKNVAGWRRETKVRRRYSSWTTEAGRDLFLIDHLREMVHSVFVGLGSDRVETIR